MGGSRKPRGRQPDEVARLTEQVQALTARLEMLESAQHPAGDGNGNGHAHGNPPQSRRDVLKLAGAAAAGAAGSILLGALPAAAASNTPLVLGNSTTNDAANTTDIFPTTGAAPTPLFQATGQGVTTTTTVQPTASSSPPNLQSIPLIGAIGPGGTLPTVSGVIDYPGFAPIQGVGGLATVSTPFGPERVSEGLNGWGGGTTGIGVTGESDKGYGLVGGSGGIDIAALGSGRMLQLPLLSKSLTTPPAGPPNFAPNDFEQVRDANGVLYVSLPGGTWIPVQLGGLNQSLFSASTTKLLALHNSDGATFLDMMPDTSVGLNGGPDLELSITPLFDCYAFISGNASLYTDTAGFNQDIGIYINPSSGPQNIVAWAESGGTAVDSPNAAFVQAVVPMARANNYDVRLKWKANHAGGGTIRAGAGPFPLSAGLASVSPSRLTVLLIVNP